MSDYDQIMFSAMTLVNNHLWRARAASAVAFRETCDPALHPAAATACAIPAYWQPAASATKPCQMAFWNFSVCQR